jgi:hypothetical protein
VGRERPASYPETDFKYKQEHMQLFDKMGLKWPPERGEFEGYPGWVFSLGGPSLDLLAGLR